MSDTVIDLRDYFIDLCDSGNGSSKVYFTIPGSVKAFEIEEMSKDNEDELHIQLKFCWADDDKDATNIYTKESAMKLFDELIVKIKELK
jgi:hypothetical protein